MDETRRIASNIAKLPTLLGAADLRRRLVGVGFGRRPYFALAFLEKYNSRTHPWRFWSLCLWT